MPKTVLNFPSVLVLGLHIVENSTIQLIGSVEGQYVDLALIVGNISVPQNLGF